MVVTLVAAAACGGARPAEPLEPPDNRAPPRPVTPPNWSVYRVAAPRPEIDVFRMLPDPTEELRWPRSATSHPVLEPTYPIAAAFARPGVSWLDLCQLGAQHRHAAGSKDLVAYLRAWCHLARRETDAALDALEPLLHSVVSQLAPAIPLDISNILVDAGDADRAERSLAKHRLYRADILDLVAATYVEVGRNDDAYEINERAMDNDSRASAKTQCRRLTRKIVLSPPVARATPLALLDGLADTTQDPTCVRLAHELDCWTVPASGCAGYFADQGIPAQSVGVLLAYYTWPYGPATFKQWWMVANAAVSALPTHGAHELAVTALESTLRTTSCDADRPLEDIRLAAMTVSTDAGHPTSLDPRLAVLMDQPRALCGTGQMSAD